jgi:hypothetical protein
VIAAWFVAISEDLPTHMRGYSIGRWDLSSTDRWTLPLLGADQSGAVEDMAAPIRGAKVAANASGWRLSALRMADLITGPSSRTGPVIRLSATGSGCGTLALTCCRWHWAITAFCAGALP